MSESAPNEEQKQKGWKVYYEKHKEKISARKAAEYIANRELYKARVIAYQARTGYNRKYYEEHKEAISAKRREDRQILLEAKRAMKLAATAV